MAGDQWLVKASVWQMKGECELVGKKKGIYHDPNDQISDDLRARVPCLAFAGCARAGCQLGGNAVPFLHSGGVVCVGQSDSMNFLDAVRIMRT